MLSYHNIRLCLSLVLTCILVCNHSAFAQVKAITESGREVVLLKNGTWHYSDSSQAGSDKDTIALNPNKFTKPSEANFLVKSNVVKVGFYINPKKWSFKKPTESGAAQEYMFDLKSKYGYAMLITERTQVELEALGNIALENAKGVAPDAELTKREYRMVNGLKVLFLEIRGTIQSIKFVYNGYYYSNASGTVQMVAYAGQSVFPEVQDELTQLLNGIKELP